MKRILTVALLMTSACAAPPVTDLRGSWGGEHLGLTVTDASSSLTFDCASGTIAEPFTLDAAGYFDLNGTYTPGTGGPEPVPPPPTRPAAYSGRVIGASMTLKVGLEEELPDSTFTLRQGESPQIYACL